MGQHPIGQAGGNEHNAEEPQTRKALNILRSQYSSTAAFLCELYADPLLQRRLMLIAWSLEDLHDEYVESQTAHEEGQQSMMRWQANVLLEATCRPTTICSNDS